MSDKTHETKSSALTIHLTGRFSATSSCGVDVTPKSSKGQGLLALLATDPDMKRTRIWLQDKLWSDRGAEQAARSLRQELSQIKKAFGDATDHIKADRKSVWLGDATVSFERDHSGPDRDFLEGIDVRDDEFNLWLASFRASQQTTIIPRAHQGFGEVHSAAKQMIAIVGRSENSVTSQVYEAQIVAAVARSLGDLSDVVVSNGSPDDLSECAVLVCINVIADAAGARYVRATVERTFDAATVWSETYPLPHETNCEPELDLGSLSLINRVFSAVCAEFSGPPLSQNAIAPARLAALAIFKCFSIEKTNLDQALVLLGNAYEQDKRGSYLAWQAQVLTINFVERYAVLDRDAREHGDRLCADAIRIDPTNSNVLAAVANYRTIVDGNKVAGLEMARLAVRANSGNPLAWWALSNSIQYFGDLDQAYIAAKRAYTLSSGTRLEFWTAFQRSLVAMINKDDVDSMRYGELSSALQPSFRPPLRYLAALYSRMQDVESGQRVVQKLVENETDFTIDRLINDDSYPASLIRKHKMMDARSLRAFDD